MFSKWYHNILLACIALLGAITLQQNVVPNQEITLKFSQENLLAQSTEDLVVIVKTQLESLGAENIQVSTTNKGELKIIYFSDEHVNEIKTSLHTSFDLKVLYTASQKQSSNSNDKEDLNFHLDVSEIQQIVDYSGLSGKLALEPNKKNDLSNQYNFNAYSSNTLYERIIIEEVVLNQISENNSRIIYSSARNKIPEVRAGPWS